MSGTAIGWAKVLLTRGMAVDGYGNVFIADYGRGNVVVSVNYFNGIGVGAFNVVSNFTVPQATGVAVDSTGTIYVSTGVAGAPVVVLSGVNSTSPGSVLYTVSDP